MEKSKERRRSRGPRMLRMTSPFCISSRIKGSNGTTRKSHVSLLDRFRDAVFRLIMLSALSKDAAVAANHNKRGCGKSSSWPSVCSPSPLEAAAYYYYPYETHHSEAVADCIEFIKKSSIPNQERGGGDDAAMAEVYYSTS